MFKKIVSRLPFSPTLIGELGFYAKRLRKEEITRRLGLVLTALALVVQSLGVLSPPESANASNLSDLIHGGVHSKSQLLAAWDNNTQGYRDLLVHAGITRENLVSSKEAHIYSRSNGQDSGWLNWSRITRGGTKYGESSFNVGSQKIYIRNLSAFDTGSNTRGNGSYYAAYIGTNSKGEQFAIMKGCANIAMKKRFTDKKIQVCDINTRTIVTIFENQFNSSTQTKDVANCQPRPIEVCDLAARKVISIDQKDFDATKHSKDLSACQPRPIEVCDLASLKVITIDERDFSQSKHSKNLEDCKPKPVAEASCSSLIANKLTRTKVELSAASRTQNGASIKSYTYIIKNSQGQEVHKRTVDSSSTNNSIQHTLDEGDYVAEVIVTTSLGDKKSTGCKTTFTVAPIERCLLNPSLPINDPACQPCPGDPTLWVKDPDCAAKVISNKTAVNLTSNKPAEQLTAQASDRIEYTLSVKNEGKDSITLDIEDNIGDVLEYGKLYDRGGGLLEESTKVLSWKQVSLQPGEEQKRTYVVQLTSSLSAMSRGSSDPTSYDCKMVNTFGNTIEINVACPTPKVIEQVVPELPRTGATANLIAGGATLAIVAFLYARSRQLNKEVRLIRREAVAGTI